MDANKRRRYEKISIELTKLVGGKENIQGGGSLCDKASNRFKRQRSGGFKSD